MTTLKQPAIFLAQFMDDKAPFNSLENICQWVASLGFKGVQIPSWDHRCMDLEKAAKSKTYADEILGIVKNAGLSITELSTHIQGQLIAVNPAYSTMFDVFVPKSLRNNPTARQKWANQQLMYAAEASKNLGLTTHASFSGALLWHTVYPWPQRPAGLVKTGFQQLAKLWLPILNKFDEHGVDIGYELHPGEDLHDGITFEMFLEATNNHPRANILYDPSHFILQQLDYLQFIDIYHQYIKVFHVKDAEFIPNGRMGVYGGYQDWSQRPGRFRSLGDGQIDFKSIFTKMAQYNFKGWPVLEWECFIKHPKDGAKEGAKFIQEHTINVTDKTFDDFAGNSTDLNTNLKILGIDKI